MEQFKSALLKSTILYMEQLQLDYIVTSNTMIAAFMGANIGEHGLATMERPNYFPQGHSLIATCLSKDLKYDSSWEWIMPVVEKMQTMENGRYHISVDPWSMMVVDYKEEEKEVLTMQFDPEEDSLLGRYYLTVCRFIEWYNKIYYAKRNVTNI